jgi:hypothetical protein
LPKISPAILWKHLQKIHYISLVEYEISEKTRWK